ncbi:unnamed protein product [Oppiella nova]|uniref:C2H2-type domain-containing protein n=1 Tax=Oppiella nova TaxID=334625 RepID=A0A7R9MG24_9ACAR|nr:unnamed protein product [Oppiella nova]CAG2176713.1 unnamed protein product [Oppiella nova]
MMDDRSVSKTSYDYHSKRVHRLSGSSHSSTPSRAEKHMNDTHMSAMVACGQTPHEMPPQMVSKTYIIPVNPDETPVDRESLFSCHSKETKEMADSGETSGVTGGSVGSVGTPLLPNDIACIVNECSYSAPNKSGLIRHLSRVHSIAPFECQYISCGKLFANKPDLDLHVNRIHLKIFHCHIHGCGKHFKSLWNLNIHLMTHSSEKRFKCNVEDCHYQCIQKRHLVAHMYKHYGLKPFHCSHETCDKSFSTIGSLRTHMSEVHVTERQFVCDFPGCDKVLKTNRYLLQHKKSHLKANAAAAHAFKYGT